MLKNQRNENGQRHGYWEYYFINGKLANKGYHDSQNAIWEAYDKNGVLISKEFII